MEVPVSRGALLHRALVGGTALLGAGALPVAARAALAEPSRDRDARLLATALRLTQLQSALYQRARQEMSIGDDLRAFARAAAAQQRGHLAAFEELLGPAARAARAVTFDEQVRSAATFAETAAWLEDLSVLALNGQVANLTPEALVTTARIASADARHAAWVRGVIAADPSHHVLDSGRSMAAVESALQRRAASSGWRL